jgi:hypothetical protein
MCTSTICRLRLPRFTKLQEIFEWPEPRLPFRTASTPTQTGSGGELPISSRPRVARC